MAPSKMTPCMFIAEGLHLYHIASFPNDSVDLCACQEKCDQQEQEKEKNKKTWQLGFLRVQCYFLSTACCCFGKSDGSDEHQMKSDENCGSFGFGASSYMGLPITVKQECLLRHLGKCCCPKGVRPRRMSRTEIRSRIVGLVRGIWIMSLCSTLSFITAFSTFRYSKFASDSCSDETLWNLLPFYIFYMVRNAKSVYVQSHAGILLSCLFGQCGK